MKKGAGGGLEPAKPQTGSGGNSSSGATDAKLEYMKVFVHNIFDKYDSYDKGFLDKEDFTKLLR